MPTFVGSLLAGVNSQAPFLPEPIRPILHRVTREILREVLDPRLRAAGGIGIYHHHQQHTPHRQFPKKLLLTRLSRNIRPILGAPIDIVIIIHLIQLGTIAPRTLNRRIDIPPRHQRSPDLLIRIRLCSARDDTRVLQKGIRIQCREKLEGLLEEIDHLLRGDVIDIARRVKGADAGAVFAPLVFPEGFVVAAVVFPVHLHVVQEVVAVEGFEDLGDVFVLPGFVAVLLVGAVAFVGPVFCGHTLVKVP